MWNVSALRLPLMQRDSLLPMKLFRLPGDFSSSQRSRSAAWAFSPRRSGFEGWVVFSSGYDQVAGGAAVFQSGLAFVFGLVRCCHPIVSGSARLDPKCAMAHWGIALAGPTHQLSLVPPPARSWPGRNYNSRRNTRARRRGRAELIKALGKRYANPQPEDRKPLDQAYADAMREVWKEHPNDPDVGAFSRRR